MDSSSNQLVVPFRIEGKFLQHSLQVTPPTADFSKLPWNNGNTDIHFNQPYVSDGLIREPFEKKLILNPGLHLHFILPHFLGKQYPNAHTGETNNQQQRMPAAPNRWLVTKKNQDTIVQRWLIQSDYIYDENDIPEEPTCIIPCNSGRPYRYMGKKISLSSLCKNNVQISAKNSFKQQSPNQQALTVVGYGDIYFSSFYPNCLGVFGFHDPQPITANEQNTNLHYSVIGWFDEDKDDLLYHSIAQFIDQNEDCTFDDLNKQLQRQFGICINTTTPNAAASVGSASIFYSDLELKVTEGQIVPPNSSTPTLKLAIGNTGTQALSALMANQLADRHHITPASSNTEQAKKTIEEQLESILLLSKIDHLKVDTTAKFVEARHEKSFDASHSGHLWKITTEHGSQLSTDNKEPAVPSLPEQLSDLLNTLNTAQAAYDQARHNIITLQEQLYADWYRYMHARYPIIEGRGEYPDADHIQYFIQHYGIDELSKLINDTGQLCYDDSNKKAPQAKSNNKTDLAHQLVTAWQTVATFLTNENKTRSSRQQPTLSLTLIAGPRYWQAKSPVLLFSGIEAETSVQTSLNCSLINSSTDLNNNISSDQLDALISHCSALPGAAYHYQFDKQQWNPFILDWAANLSNPHLRLSSGSINPQGLKNNFRLHQSQPEFEKSHYTTGRLSVFSGSVLMSGHAKVAVLKNIEQFFTASFDKEKISFQANKTLDDFFQYAVSLSDGDSTADAWSSALKLLNLNADIGANGVFKQQSSTSDISNPYFTAWLTYGQLSKGQVISQTLNGFNEACIMRKKVPQFPIAEPIGFDYAKQFTANVKSLVKNQRHSSPIMAFDFNPVRAGAFNLDRLSLIDNFGDSHEVDIAQLTTVTAQTLQDDKGKAFLYPRLAQPARLNFRWQSAEPLPSGTVGTSVDSNDHPNTSPICGWLLANYLNGDIAVYDADGNALGYISQVQDPTAGSTGQWNIVPWADKALDIQTNIANSHLRKVVTWLCQTSNQATSASSSLINDFLTATQVALNNIAPSNANQHNVKSILMGRPMAVVRASMSFELKGKPALNQSWSSLLTDMHNCQQNPSWCYDDRNQDNWTQLQLPCRLGEHRQLNDGLIGYWMEQANNTLSSTFIAPEIHSSDITDNHIEGISNTAFPTQWLPLNSQPANLTLLMDPRGLLHATTGCLPSKALSIPAEHYLPAMQKMALWFKTGPLLQSDSQYNKAVTLEMPKVNDYQWQWWDAFQGSLPLVKEDTTKHHHDDARIIEGWLSLCPNTAAKG